MPRSGESEGRGYKYVSYGVDGNCFGSKHTLYKHARSWLGGGLGITDGAQVANDVAGPRG